MKYLILSLLSTTVFALPLKVRKKVTFNCKSHWTYFNETNSCYYVGSDKNWDSAEADCVSMKAHLTSIENAFENTFVASLTEEDKSLNEGQMTWIGLRHQQNNWTWADGSITRYRNWVEGSLKEDANKYACVVILRDDYKGSKTYWNNVECGTIMRKYVCKQPAGTWMDFHTLLM